MLSELLHLKISCWQQVSSSAYLAHWLLLSLRHNLRSQRSHLFDFDPLVCCESGTAARLSVSSSSIVYLPPSHTAALASRQVGPRHFVCQHRTVPASLSQDKAHNSRISNPGILIWGRPVQLRGGVGWRQGQKEKEEGEALFGEAWAWWQEASPPLGLRPYVRVHILPDNFLRHFASSSTSKPKSSSPTSCSWRIKETFQQYIYSRNFYVLEEF